MTYLDIVNNVLKRLRERPVGTINESRYSTLIGVLVNDAKDTVENAWSWSALRTTLSATTESGVFNYVLTGSQNKITILDVLNDTDDVFLHYLPAHEMTKYYLIGTPQTGSPTHYSFNGVDADGDTQVDIYPKPDGAYDLRFNCIQRNPELSSDTDSINIPSRPIEMLAYALAVEERGEDGGMNPVSAFARAKNALDDAIALDAIKHPEETLFYEV